MIVIRATCSSMSQNVTLFAYSLTQNYNFPRTFISWISFTRSSNILPTNLGLCRFRIKNVWFGIIQIIKSCNWFCIRYQILLEVMFFFKLEYAILQSWNKVIFDISAYLDTFVWYFSAPWENVIHFLIWTWNCRFRMFLLWSKPRFAYQTAT